MSRNLYTNPWDVKLIKWAEDKPFLMGLARFCRLNQKRSSDT